MKTYQVVLNIDVKNITKSIDVVIKEITKNILPITLECKKCGDSFETVEPNINVCKECINEQTKHITNVKEQQQQEESND